LSLSKFEIVFLLKNAAKASTPPTSKAVFIFEKYLKRLYIL
jgi:hypothetical protein